MKSKRSSSPADPPTPELFDLLHLLKQDKRRITKTRIRLLKSLLAATKPLSIEELRTGTDTTGSSADYSTTYRFLLQLEELRLVRRVHVSPGVSHFTLLLPNQSRGYLVCTACGDINAVETSPPILEAEHLIAIRHGFTSITHSLDFYGVCPECTSSRA